MVILTRAGYDTRSIFKRSLTGLNSDFSFSWTSCLTKAEERSLPYYLPIAGGRIIGFIPFPRVLVLCEMQSVSSRIWTRVAVSIFYDDNHYTIIEVTVSLGGPHARSIFSIFPLFVESNALEKPSDKSVASKSLHVPLRWFDKKNCWSIYMLLKWINQSLRSSCSLVFWNRFKMDQEKNEKILIKFFFPHFKSTHQKMWRFQ